MPSFLVCIKDTRSEIIANRNNSESKAKIVTVSK
jgi:hypothetical protein